MSRLLALCLSVALISACKKNDSESASPAKEPVAVTGVSDTAGTNEAADSPANGSDAPAQPGAEHAEKQVEAENDGKQVENETDGIVVLEASMVEPYVTYRRDWLAAVIKASKAFRAAAEEARSKTGSGKVDATDNDGEMEREMEEAVKKSGLTEAQMTALSEIATAVVSVPVAANAPAEGEQAGEEGAIPQQLAAAARVKYGDAVVDAMLERREELQRLDDEEEMVAHGNEQEYMQQEREELGRADEE